MRRFRGVVLSACLLASCGGGGGAGSAALPVAPGGGLASNAQAAAKIQVHIPAPAPSSVSRRRNFVSSAVQGATVAVGPHGGTLTTYAFDLSATSQLCTTSGSGRSCTMTVQAPYGNDDFIITLYDAAPVNGMIPATAHILGQATDSNISITPGGTLPTMNVYVSGTIANIGLNDNLITFPADHSSHSASVTINPTDFSNQPIVTGANDPYSNPISVTLTQTGGTGDFQLTVNGAVTTSPYTMTQSGQTIGVTYDGAGASGDYATLTFAAANVPTQTLQIAPLYVAPNNPYSNGTLVQFTAPGQSQRFSVSEAQGSLAYTTSITGAAPCSSAASSGTVSGSTANATATFVSTATAVATSNGCSFTIADANGSSLSFPFNNTVTGSGPIAIGGITEYATMSGPEPIIAGPDGNVWVGGTVATTAELFTTAGSGTPYSTSPHTVLAMTDAADGNIWYVDGSNVVSKLTTSGVSSFYSVGAAGASFTSITEGPDGNAWALDTANGILYDVSAYGATLNTYSAGCTKTCKAALGAGSTGGIYVLDNASPTAQLWTITPGASPGSPLVLPGTNPQAMTLDSAGNVYVTEAGTNSVDYYDLSTASVDSSGIALPSGTSPRGVAVDGAGNVWVAGSGNDTLVKVASPLTAPSSVAYGIPTASASPIGIALGPDGRIWFTEFSTSKIGVIQP